MGEQTIIVPRGLSQGFFKKITSLDLKRVKMAQIEIKNRYGELLGYLKDESDGRKSAWMRQGQLLGYYNPKDNTTKDRMSNLLAKGDILSSLIMQGGK